MNEGALPELPGGWVWTTIEDILLALESGGRPKGGVRGIKEGIPSIGGEHLLYNGRFDFTDIRYVPREFYEKMNRGKILKRDVLVVKDGATTGKTSFVPDSFPLNEAAVNEHVFILRVFEQYTEPKYLFFWMQSSFGQKCVKDNFQGTAQGGINSMFVKNSNFPLPPLPEQRRIITKIEELFTKLDAGVEVLKKTQAQLKHYRQSVLKAACEGKLVQTEAELAKVEGRDYEPADALLTRILKERREKSRGAKYKEPAAPDTNGLSKLPEGWGWATLEQLSWDSGYGTSEKCDYNFSGPPVLRIPNISEGRITLNDIKFASESTNLNETESLAYGDMLVIRTNGSKDLIGRAGVVTQNFNKPYFFASYLIRFRIVEFGGLPIWLSSIWHTSRIRSWIERVAATSAGQYNISMSTLNKLPLELPPIAEQRRIVAEVERRLSVADEVARTVEQSLVQAQRLRQSILKKAFEGKLVAQAPEDEPASALLERIKAGKEGKKKQKRKKQ